MKFFLTLFVLALVGCQNYIPFVYQPPIQQGNLLEEDKVDQLEVGMTREQVDFLLGAPISHNTFADDRYDYVYYYKEKYKEPVHKKLTVYFSKEGKVTKFVK
ncbi:MAG: outer membrane protein assembly factor BamE [Gammaproteobacteria bacterium]